MKSGLQNRRSVRRILCALLCQVTQKKPITYGELGEETDFPPHFLGSHLGNINNRLRLLGEQWGEDIPPLSVLVVNAETRLPGSKFAPFIGMTPEEYDALSLRERQRRVGQVQRDVYAYGKWDKVKREY